MSCHIRQKTPLDSAGFSSPLELSEKAWNDPNIGVSDRIGDVAFSFGFIEEQDADSTAEEEHISMGFPANLPYNSIIRQEKIVKWMGGQS